MLAYVQNSAITASRVLAHQHRCDLRCSSAEVNNLASQQQLNFNYSKLINLLEPPGASVAGGCVLVLDVMFGGLFHEHKCYQDGDCKQ